MALDRRVTVVGGERLTGELLATALRRRGAFEAEWFEQEQETHLDEGCVALVVDPAPALLRGVTHRGARAVAVVTGGAPSTDDEVGLLLGGADAVVSVDTGTDEVLRSVEVVSSGGAEVTPGRLRVLLERLRQRGPRVASSDDLTTRERQILVSIDKGESVKQTARSLGISPKTVENLQSKLFTKLDARNRAQAVSHAHNLGLLGEGGSLLVDTERETETNGTNGATGAAEATTSA
jgi:DNA-binding NarL/FixJ family response regulator